jgi:hypothetical protein
VAGASILGSAWLGLRLAGERAAVAELTGRLAEAQRRADELAADRGEMAARSERLAGQLAMVTTPGVEVCPLHPMPEGEGGAAAEAGALLYMTPGDGRWYLRVHGLPPPPEGTVYVLWFLGEGGSHTSGGVVRMAAGEVAERAAPGGLSEGALPELPKMSRGVAVTVERAPDVTEPAGPMVLFGEERMSLL